MDLVARGTLDNTDRTAERVTPEVNATAVLNDK